MEKNQKIKFSDIAEVVHLKSAVDKLHLEQPSLKDREWLEEGLSEKLEELSKELQDKTYTVASLNYSYQQEDHRNILSAQMNCRDWLVHQSLCDRLAPFFEASQYEFASYKPKELDKIVTQCRRWKKENNFVLGLDIRQFFLAISHDRLIDTLSPKIKDKEVLWLLNQFIQAYDKAALSFSAKEKEFRYMPNFSLPIGMELSSILANAYLQIIDSEINSWPEEIVFARYIDDFLFFAKDENVLLEKKGELEELAGKLGFQYNSGKTIFGSTAYGFEYMGCDF